MSSRLGVAVRALVVLAVTLGAVPWLLVAAARARFGGPAPWSSLAPVDTWHLAGIRAALTDRLTDAVIADIVIRVALGAAWLAVGVFAVTVVAEAVHMARHGGLSMPRVRAVGFAQPLARLVATGLLVVVPLAGSVSRSSAAGSSLLVVTGSAAPPAAVVEVGDAAEVASPVVVRQSAGEVDGGYLVRPGDSVYAIAERIAGPDRRAVVAYADELLDLNLGRTMTDGQVFTNAALIHVGWTLELPSHAADSGETDVHDGVHVVSVGESLWSIAGARLGDPELWPTVFDANRGRVFADGRTLDDPDVIRPGWQLVIPDPAAPAGAVVEPLGALPPIVPEFGDDPPVPAPVDEPAGGEIDADEPSAPPPAGESPRPDNVWLDPIDPTLPVGIAPRAASANDDEIAAAVDDDVDDADDADDAAGVRLLTYRRAAMLSAGLVTLVTVRRRARLRTAPAGSRLPDMSARATVVERSARALDAGERFARVDLAIRHAALPLVESRTRVAAACVAADGSVELFAAGIATLPAPWERVDGARWRLPAAVPVEVLAQGARRVGSPCPTLVQLGRDSGGRDVYVDLEAFGAIEVGGRDVDANAIVTAVAATLASSVLAEVASLVSVAVPEAALFGHRHHRSAPSVAAALVGATDALGSTAAAERTTFDLRARVTSGEMWEPAVVLVGSAAGPVTLPTVATGLAVVSAAPIHGPSSRLAPDGDEWELLPIGLRFVPLGVPPADVGALADLVDVAEPVAPSRASAAALGTATLDELDDEAPVEPAFVVRLLGPVRVESGDGTEVTFERSKTRELVAWLATHRGRSTRSSARAALWELDVRDATFHNVVSEARRALARCVEPPEGEEWLGRTTNDSLPLHPLVVTDAELVERALARAAVLEPQEALDALRPALDWVVGMPFEATSYLWPDAEGIASDLLMTALTLCDTVARLALSVGDVARAFEASARGLQVLPGHEDMVELRMRAHAQLGDRAGLRHEWESYERAITADPWSDGEPSDRMCALRHELFTASRHGSGQT